MIYLVHGEDEFRRAEWLSEQRRSVATDRTVAELNTATLNGQRLTIEELEGACGAVPFLAERRLVVVEGLLSRGQGGGKGEGGKRSAKSTLENQVLDYLKRLPPTTDLVFVEAQTVQPNTKFLSGLVSAGGKVIEMQPPKPDSYELRRWVTERAVRHGTNIAPDAAERLAAYVGNNLRLLDQELAKLATYADGATVTVEDVKNLVSSVREANVFEMVDAMGRRDTRRALALLHELQADGQSPVYLLFMVARQVRLLMQARDLIERGVPPTSLASELGIHSFVAQKITQQARNFSTARLYRMHQSLVDLDWAVKTGKMEPGPAVDTFVATATTS